MVVLFGHQNDQCPHLVYEYLRRQGAEVVFIENSRLLTALSINWLPVRSDDESFLMVDSQKIPFAAISGVLARLPYPITPPAEVPHQDQQYIAHELHATLRVKKGGNISKRFLLSRPLLSFIKPPPGSASAMPWSISSAAVQCEGKETGYARGQTGIG